MCWPIPSISFSMVPQALVFPNSNLKELKNDSCLPLCHGFPFRPVPKSSVGRPLQALAYGIERWRSIAAFFAINHWRLRTLTNEARLASHMALNSDLEGVPKDAPLILVQQAFDIEAKVVALDRALEAVCAENGIDPEDIRRLSATEPCRSLMPSLSPDVQFEREMVTAMQEAF